MKASFPVGCLVQLSLRRRSGGGQNRMNFLLCGSQPVLQCSRQEGSLFPVTGKDELVALQEHLCHREVTMDLKALFLAFSVNIPWDFDCTYAAFAQFGSTVICHWIMVSI